MMTENAPQTPEPLHPSNKRISPVGCIVILLLLITVPILLTWLFLSVIQPWYESGGFSKISEKFSSSDQQSPNGGSPGANAPGAETADINAYISGMAMSMPGNRGAQFPSACQKYLAIYPNINQDQQLLLISLLYQCFSADGKIDKNDDRYIQQTMQIFLQINSQSPKTPTTNQPPPSLKKK
jgi:hypothetical protein